MEATEALRGLIDAIILTPSDGELRIELKGNLAAMLSAATKAKRSPVSGDLSLQVEMVAGGAQPPLSAVVALGRVERQREDTQFFAKLTMVGTLAPPVGRDPSPA